VSIAFLFVDGLGITADPRSPLHTTQLPTLSGLTNHFATEPHDQPGSAYRVLDATLGVEGLPQSATGQTTLLTGVNGAQVLGRHQGPHPGSQMQALLNEESLPVWATRRGLRVLHANGYRSEYLERVLGARRNMMSAFAFAARAAGQMLLLSTDPRAHRPARWADPLAAGAAFAAAAEQHHLTVLEYFMLDFAGHREPERVPDGLRELDAFVSGYRLASPAATLVICSDHGNAEEPWHTRHTRNPVPFIACGPDAVSVPAMTSIADLSGWIRDRLGNEPRTEDRQ
jgi:2,3-bisphosphoglycerate-independent phosphoglycerate mutase